VDCWPGFLKLWQGSWFLRSSEKKHLMYTLFVLVTDVQETSTSNLNLIFDASFLCREHQTEHVLFRSRNLHTKVLAASCYDRHASFLYKFFIHVSPVLGIVSFSRGNLYVLRTVLILLFISVICHLGLLEFVLSVTFLCMCTPVNGRHSMHSSHAVCPSAVSGM